MPQKPLPPVPPTLNQVLFALLGPCAPNPFVLVGLAAFDAITAWWSIVSPNWKDTVKAGPGNRSWTHQLKETLFDAEEAAPEWWYMFGDVAIFCFEILDMFAFWFMVGYVLENALLQWTSQIWQMSGCFPKPNHYYIYSKDPLGNYYGGQDPWQAACAWFDLSTNTGMSELGTEITVPANSSFSFSIMTQWENAVGETLTPMNVRVVDLTHNQIQVLNNWNPEKHDAKYSNGVIFRQTTPPDYAVTYQIQFEQAVGKDLWAVTTGGHLAIEWDTYPTFDFPD